MMRRRNLKRDSQRPSVVPPVHSSVEAEGEDGIGVWFTLASFAVGFALCYAGCQLEIPISFHPGLGFIGLGIIQLGLETIRTREDRYRLGDESTRDETFRDLPAVMSGFFWTCLGFGLLAYAILAAVGLQDVASAFLKARPGLAWMMIGVMLVSFSVPMVVGPIEDRAPCWLFLVGCLAAPSASSSCWSE